MKKILTLSIMLFFFEKLAAQNFLSVYFEDSTTINQHIEIDTVNYPNNKWQIGKPMKPLFDSAYSPYNVIVTDTINFLPASDTSVFILKHVRPFSFPTPSFSMNEFRFYYKMDKGITDIAKIEIAADTGKHWVNMMDEDTTYNIQWYGMKPNFNANLNNWIVFRANFSQWFSTNYNGMTTYPYYADADTFLYRFTFITDSLSANKEGWMIDNIETFFAIPESVSSNTKNSNSMLFYPNPIQNQIFLKRSNLKSSQNERLEIFSILGQKVYTSQVNNISKLEVNLPKGQYLIKYYADNVIETQKIMIE